MNAQFSWGVWLSTETPLKGKASGAMTESTFRKLLASLTEVTGSTDSALDRIKEIMVLELNKLRIKHDA